MAAVTMHFSAAQYPEPAASDDRVFITENAAVVLDGASAFVPVDVSTGTYVDTLGRHLSDALRCDPAGRLDQLVASAIASTAHELSLTPGNSPSSTVSVIRGRNAIVDLFVLGDSCIYYGNEATAQALTDARIADLEIPEHAGYRTRLAGGSGYDDIHRELLGRLQSAQRTRRNRAGGYWIAEADSQAARHGFTRTLTTEQLTWAVVATDGAYKPMHHLGLDDWRTVAGYDAARLGQILRECAEWEHTADPHGRQAPRAKVSDDKALVAAQFN
jgi:hypothetical protein